MDAVDTWWREALYVVGVVGAIGLGLSVLYLFDLLDALFNLVFTLICVVAPVAALVVWLVSR